LEEAVQVPMEDKQEEGGTPKTVHQTFISLVNVLPDKIDAGTDFSLKFRVYCSSGCVLETGTVKVLDGDGNPAAGAVPVRAEAEGGGYETEQFFVKAPQTPGDYTWTAVFSGFPEEAPGAQDKGAGEAAAPDKETGAASVGAAAPAEKAGTEPAGESTEHAESSVEFSFTVRAHLISVSIWNVPIPAARGEKFTIGIGASCSAGCSLAGQAIVIEDPETGKQIAKGTLGEELLAQTKATYWTEQELTAPSEDNVYRWTVSCKLPEDQLPHELDAGRLVFRAAAPPRFTVTVKVSDDRDFLPLDAADIQLGFHKAATGKDGTAVLKAPEGEQELVIVKMNYATYETTVNISGDTTLSAALEFAPQL
jgi:hypothetical protein